MSEFGTATDKYLGRLFTKHPELRERYIGSALVIHTCLPSQQPEKLAYTSRNCINLLAGSGVEGDTSSSSLRSINYTDGLLALTKAPCIVNLEQVRITSVAESDEIAAAMGLPSGAMPAGVQLEHLALGEGPMRLAELPNGTLMLFHHSLRGRPRTASIQLVGVKSPNGIHEVIAQSMGDRLPRGASHYKEVATNRTGRTAVVMTGGIVYSLDTATFWTPDGR